MRKFIIAIALLLAVFTVTEAQKFVPIYYFGTSITNYSGNTDDYADVLQYIYEPVDEYGYVISMPVDSRSRWLMFNTGFAVAYNPAEWFTLQAGVEYAPRGIVFKGHAEKDGYYTVYFKETWMVRYLDFPVTAKLSALMNKYNGSRIYAIIGIAPSVKLSSVIHTKQWDEVGEWFDTKDKSRDYVSNYDFNMIYGMGFDFKAQYLEFKYERGSKNVVAVEDTYADWENVMVNITWGFKLGKNRVKN